MRNLFLLPLRNNILVYYDAMKTILFFQTANSPSNQSQLSGILRTAKTFGWHVRVVQFSDPVPDKQNSGLPSLLQDVAKLKAFWSPIGIIIDCGGLSKRPDRKMFTLPTVFLDSRPDDLWRGAVCVHVDNAEVGRTAAQELLSLNARAYAYVPFTSSKSWSLEREQAFTEAIRLNHFPCHVFRKRCNADIYMLSLDQWIAMLPKPVAIFAANDHVSDIVVDLAIRNGFSVPDDIAVIGVDNDEHICLRSNPTLSSIKPDHEKAGFLAAQLLREFIKTPKHPPASATFGPIAVVHRETTRAIRRHDERTMRLLRAIRERATTGLSVAQLVKGLGVSRRTVEMQFREATGRSILQEILNLRIEHAKLLLTQTYDKIDEVAKKSGYPSSQAFRKHFTKTVGVSPLTFRKRGRTIGV